MPGQVDDAAEQHLRRSLTYCTKSAARLNQKLEFFADFASKALGGVDKDALARVMKDVVARSGELPDACLMNSDEARCKVQVPGLSHPKRGCLTLVPF